MKLKHLRIPEVAAHYIIACIEEGDPLNECLADVIKAHGLAALARATGIAAPNLLRVTRKGSNPTIATIRAILHALGMELTVVPWKPPKKKARQKRKPKLLAKAA
jgi:probable addiction module antidote protein